MLFRSLVFLFQKQHTQQSQNSGSTLLQNNLLNYPETSQKIKESEERLASIEKELASNSERLELLKNVDIQRYAEQSSKLNEAKKTITR